MLLPQMEKCQNLSRKTGLLTAPSAPIIEWFMSFCRASAKAVGSKSAAPAAADSACNPPPSRHSHRRRRRRGLPGGEPGDFLAGRGRRRPPRNRPFDVRRPRAGAAAAGRTSFEGILARFPRRRPEPGDHRADHAGPGGCGGAPGLCPGSGAELPAASCRAERV